MEVQGRFIYIRSLTTQIGSVNPYEYTFYFSAKLVVYFEWDSRQVSLDGHESLQGTETTRMG